MQKTVLIGLFAGAVLSGCATDGIAPMSQEQIADCLQPNRRVVVEFGGMRPLPAPKPKPGAAAPEAKPEAKRGAELGAELEYDHVGAPAARGRERDGCST